MYVVAKGMLYRSAIRRTPRAISLEELTSLSTVMNSCCTAG